MTEPYTKMDFYLNEQNAIDRLVAEWKKYGKIVIAFDFDNTVFDFHNQGFKFDNVIKLLRECAVFGAHLFCFTARSEDEYQFIAEYLYANGIPCDAINESPIPLPVSGNKKPYYNILLDDRAGLSSAYFTLMAALETMKGVIPS